MSTRATWLSSARPRSVWTPLILGGALALALSVALLWRSPTAWLRWGLVSRWAPEGRPIPMVTIMAEELARGQEGQLRLAVGALLAKPGREHPAVAVLHRFEPSLALVDEDGASIPLEPVDGWERPDAGIGTAAVVIPQVPDGRYRLVASADTPAGVARAELPLAFFTPAIVHLATDRPLFEPGQTMQFRAVTMSLADLAPLDGRPGRFEVRDPEGTVLLDEEVPAGVYGVAASDLPLSHRAPVGDYTVAYHSGDAVDRVTVRVEPFRLPRFAVQLSADRGWYGAGEAPRIDGRLRYHSGAAVRDAHVEARLVGPNGGWPLPTPWRAPRRLRTDGDGAFSHELEAVPDDLIGRVTATVELVATDATGERVTGSLPVVLSADPVAIAVETELGQGLVPDLNNRLYLRLTTPDGLALDGAQLRVSRAWETADHGVLAETDADGVAALQLDPGQPSSVLVPPRPVRPPLPVEESLVQRVSVDDLYTRSIPSLDERIALDSWSPALEACADGVPTGETHRVSLVVELDATGRVRDVLPAEGDLGRCLARRVRALRGHPGAVRAYALVFEVAASEGAELRLVELEGAPAPSSSVRATLLDAVKRARPCVVDRREAVAFPRFLAWRGQRGEERLTARWEPSAGTGGGWRPAELACVARAFGDLILDEPLAEDMLGAARMVVAPDPALAVPARSPTVRQGYALRVEASRDGVSLGETTVVVDPGRAPALRLRPDEPVLAAGDPIRIRLLRGPSFERSLPTAEDRFPLSRGGEEIGELSYDARENALVGVVPVEPAPYGLLTVQALGQRAVVYVPRPDALSLSVEPERAQVRPGELARLAVHTAVDERPSPAAVSLFGVDGALAQLAPLLSPDDFGRVTVQATTRGSAFGVFDARDLLTGRIHGPNAVLATLLRLNRIPSLDRDERLVSGRAETSADVDARRVEAFYALLGQAVREVARWEDETAEGVLMDPPTMAALWERAIAEQAEHERPHTDAFGRPLTLDRLPDDLLRLTDPRWLVGDARRLPEDVQDWAGWVRTELP